jgi:oligoribonuclease NrnB/cAMP/cGMP phosphodiesterase (DHH superfamily)
MSNKIICYYHDDLDGIASAAIVKNYFQSDIELIRVNYGDMWKSEDVEGNEVFVLDFSFPSMMDLAHSCRVLNWVDHHRTAMEQQKRAWNSEDIFGIRSLDKSGCELTFEYMNPAGKPVPDIIKYIGDMDMWKFNYKRTRVICEAAQYDLTGPNSDLWPILFTPALADQILDDLEVHGSMLLEAKRQRVKRIFEKGTDVTLFGQRARLMNATSDISEAGEYVYSQSEYDMAVMWQVVSGEVVLSFRSNSVDVGKIAEQFGGGGHKAASGATVDFPTLLKIMEGNL